MADEHDSDRSEDPTQKRLDEALERGDVVKSQEVSTWFVIGGGALMLSAFSGSMSSGLTTTFRGFIANSYQIPVDGRGPHFADGTRRARGAGGDRAAARPCWCWPRSPAT